jgi:general secretion pathway protein E
MLAAKIQLFECEQSHHATATPPVGDWLEFAGYLARKHSIRGDLISQAGAVGQPPKERKLRDLLALTELSPHEFADEVAGFFKLPRLDLPQLLAATSLAGHFSRRFLREMTIFPCQTEATAGRTLVVADPSDLSTIRAADIVLGGPLAIAVASFEDITTALSERLGEDGFGGPSSTGAPAEHADDVDSLRDLASGAPVFVLSTTFWRKLSSFVQPTFISSHYAPR